MHLILWHLHVVRHEDFLGSWGCLLPAQNKTKIEVIRNTKTQDWSYMEATAKLSKNPSKYFSYMLLVDRKTRLESQIYRYSFLDAFWFWFNFCQNIMNWSKSLYFHTCLIFPLKAVEWTLLVITQNNYSIKPYLEMSNGESWWF